MWSTTPSLDSVTRPRIALAVVYAAAAASIGYYAYTTSSRASEAVPAQGLHRSNAVRRSRRSRRSRTQSSSSSEIAGDENMEMPLGDQMEDSETFVGEGEDTWWDDHGDLAAGQPRAGHNIVNLLFRVSEDNARRNGCVHRGCQCNSCGMAPIRGVRYRCVNCADFDLCETCESQGMHTKAHIFYKIKVPVPPFSPRQMQPVWYTGDPDSCHRNLPKSLIPRLTAATGFERPELEAFWEQWTFMANTEWRNDPDGLYLTMDRKTFERCLVPTGGSRHAAPNLIHDRMFAFYDEDKDGYISFEEFLKGLAYRKQKDKLEKVFQGYDIDGDGLVNRKDFLRMFRAYYVLYKQMHRDILDGLEDQVISSTEAQQLIASRQPLSGLFGREGGISRGDTSFRLEGKTIHRNGHIDLDEGERGPVAENRGDTASRQDILTSLFACETDQRSRWRALARAAAGDESDQQRHSHVSDADRPYLVTLLEPPSNLDELPDAVMGEMTLELDETTSSNGDDDEERRDVGNESYIESLIGAQTYSRRKTSEAEKKRRDMARARLHDRWKRRQFYLDEEEGGQAPDDWKSSEDVLGDGFSNGESSKASLANDVRPSATYSSAYNSSRTEERGDIFIPGPERDAGREILYQVTQQAFNELLDTIFKPSEDIAVRARETREQREKHKDAISEFHLGQYQREREEAPTPQAYDAPTPGADPRDRYNVSTPGPESINRSLEQLLDETGYSVILAAEPRNGVDLDEASHPRGERHDTEEEHEDSSSESGSESTDSSEGFDPTMPQFRPDTMTWDEMHRLDRVTYPVTRPQASRKVSEEPELTPEILQDWKVLTLAEEKARKRGGWGRLDFAEFEEIYRSQEYQGNRLDYLGSWIDFCIP